MPDQELCHFVPVEEIVEQARVLFAEEKQKLTNLLAGCDISIEQYGSTVIPGSLTKKDLDIHISVAREHFPKLIEAMKGYVSEKHPTLWTSEFAVFYSSANELPIDYVVTVVGTPKDKHYGPARDLLIKNPELLRQYNDFKRSFEGKPYKEYSAAKGIFWKDMIGKYLSPKASS